MSFADSRGGVHFGADEDPHQPSLAEQNNAAMEVFDEFIESFHENEKSQSPDDKNIHTREAARSVRMANVAEIKSKYSLKLSKIKIKLNDLRRHTGDALNDVRDVPPDEPGGEKENKAELRNAINMKSIAVATKLEAKRRQVEDEYNTELEKLGASLHECCIQ